MFNIRENTYTPKEVEDATGFTVATLATWRSRGRGPKFIRLMGRIYYPKNDLQDWLNTQIQASA